MTIEQLESLEAQYGPKQPSRLSQSNGGKKKQMQHMAALRAKEICEKHGYSWPR